ncbi:MAG: molybdate ABC transporter permease subunit [Myxococcota bacterium]
MKLLRRLAALLLVSLLLVPLALLAGSVGPADVASALADERALRALGVSLRTALASLLLILVLGTPLALWLSRATGRTARVVEACVDLPVLLPPAVAGVALLSAFGARGPWVALFGSDASLAFTSAAVILAQVFVGSPFYVRSATEAFRTVDAESLLVARSLGAGPWRAFREVGLPATAPALAAGATLSLARALGEFGATLIFAGSLMGRTQTLPLAIYAALEDDLGLAVALSLLLTLTALALLACVRLLVRSA